MASLEMTKSLEELVAWIEAESGVCDDVLKPDEITAPLMAEVTGKSDQAARYYLEKLVDAGKMTRDKRVYNGRRQVIYRRVG